MESCVRKDPFVSLYLYENGIPCQPEKLRVRRSEADKFFTKSGKCFYYHAKALFSLEGEIVTCLSGLADLSAYVLVIPHETFIPSNYEQSFCEIIEKRKSKLKRHQSKSVPTIPCANKRQDSECEDVGVTRAKKTASKLCCGDKQSKPRQSECDKQPKKPIPHRHCVTKDKYPCCDQDSDLEKEVKFSAPRKKSSDRFGCTSDCEIPREPIPHRHCVTKDKYPCCDQDSDGGKNEPVRQSRSKSKPVCCDVPRKPSRRCDMSDEEICEPEPLHSKQRKKPEKRPEDCPPKPGLFAKCCPCCVKKPKIRPKSQFCSTKTTKLTQTTPSDLDCARKILKIAIKEDKKRKQMYGKNKKPKTDLSCAKDREEKIIDDELCLDEAERKKKETAYRSAREKYRQRRKKMEEKIIKQFEKQQKADERNKCK